MLSSGFGVRSSADKLVKSDNKRFAYDPSFTTSTRQLGPSRLENISDIVYII